jgi:hypothetical protein
MKHVKICPPERFVLAERESKGGKELKISRTKDSLVKLDVYGTACPGISWTTGHCKQWHCMS